MLPEIIFKTTGDEETRTGCDSISRYAAGSLASADWCVGAPSELADWIQEELDRARQQYAGGENARVADSDIQPGLPFLFNRLVNA